MTFLFFVEKPACKASISCVIILARVADALNDISLQTFQTLSFPENQAKQEKTCKIFDDYKTCAADNAQKNSCSPSGSMDVTVTTAAEVVCDEKLRNLTRENQECMEESMKTDTFSNCSKSFGTVVTPDDVKAALSGESSQVCHIVEKVSSYETCTRPSIMDACGDGALEMVTILREKIDYTTNKSNCVFTTPARMFLIVVGGSVVCRTRDVVVAMQFGKLAHEAMVVTIS